MVAIPNAKAKNKAISLFLTFNNKISIKKLLKEE